MTDWLNYYLLIIQYCQYIELRSANVLIRWKEMWAHQQMCLQFNFVCHIAYMGMGLSIYFRQIHNWPFIHLSALVDKCPHRCMCPKTKSIRFNCPRKNRRLSLNWLLREGFKLKKVKTWWKFPCQVGPPPSPPPMMEFFFSILLDIRPFSKNTLKNFHFALWNFQID